MWPVLDGAAAEAAYEVPLGYGECLALPVNQRGELSLVGATA